MPLTRRTLLIATGIGTASLATNSAHTIGDEESLETAFEKGFQELFTRAFQQRQDGSWELTRVAARGYKELSHPQLDSIVAFLNQQEFLESPSRSKLIGADSASNQQFGAQDFIIGTLKGIVPGEFFANLDYGNIYLWIKQHSWGKLSRYMAKHAGKKGIKDLVKFTPAGIAGAVLASMVGCAVWG